MSVGLDSGSVPGLQSGLVTGLDSADLMKTSCSPGTDPVRVFGLLPHDFSQPLQETLHSSLTFHFTNMKLHLCSSNPSGTKASERDPVTRTGTGFRPSVWDSGVSGPNRVHSHYVSEQRSTPLTPADDHYKLR
ncbi:hypothetical protein WMY93_025983 [Mugilogobius chulae]|uniref:Uncharacterized protein n=1 Tax=Mugilogobius chulae TaxID=88201 RepID=A0AAW0N8L8_9GOBI